MAGKSRIDILGGQLDQATKQQGATAGALGGQVNQSRAQVNNQIAGGQGTLNSYLTNAMQAAMPEFNQRMQGLRENEIARGVSTGGLGTSYEGDLASAFQRNIAQAGASEAMNLYNTNLNALTGLYNSDVNRQTNAENNYLDLLTGSLDQAQAAKNARQQALVQGLSSISSAAATYAGLH